MQARDIDSIERFWELAISQWLGGNTRPLATALLDKGKPIEGDNIRFFLSELAAGPVKRGKGGRPSERYPWIERAHVAAVFAKWEELGSKEKAIDAVAPARGIAPGELLGIVNKLRKDGFTFENWKSWGRPNFASTKPR